MTHIVNAVQTRRAPPTPITGPRVGAGASARRSLPLQDGPPVPKGGARPTRDQARKSLPPIPSPAPPRRALLDGRDTPRPLTKSKARDALATPVRRSTTPHAPASLTMVHPNVQDTDDRLYTAIDPSFVRRETYSPEAMYGFPDIITEPSIGYTDNDGASWELRTETAEQYHEYGEDSTLADLQATHARQITHYRNLLVRAQSASSSSLHDLHARLHHVEKEYAVLKAEHDGCARRQRDEEQRRNAENQVIEDVGSGRGLGAVARGLSKEERVNLLGVIAEACHPSDINAQIAILEEYKRSRYDILARLGDELAVKLLTLLEVRDILNLRTVSKEYKALTKQAELWKKLCRQLEWRDWDGETGLAHLDDEPKDGWEQLYKCLWQRERNWNSGSAQSVVLLKGHTNYVTSLRLRGNILISGSYDETIRVWNLPSEASSIPAPIVLPAKSVSCLDYYLPEEVFVAGYHDIGRVQVWRKPKDEWDVTHTLSGHLHGIRAVALNDKWLVSAGADKALVVWSWRTGEKVVRFGQQTNICIGIQLIHDQIVAVTVDGIVRTFSIRKREMMAQYRIADLGKGLQYQREMKGKLKDIGGGIGGTGMLTWFEGQGRYMTCTTREMIIRLAWDETEEEVPSEITNNDSSPVKASFASPSPRTRKDSSTLLTSTSNAPIKRHTDSTSSKKTATPTRSPVNSIGLSTPSPLRRKSAPNSPSLSLNVSGRASPSISIRSTRTTSTSPLKATSPFTRSTPSSISTRDSVAKPISENANSSSPHLAIPTSTDSSLSQNKLTATKKKRIIPLLSKAPKVLEVIIAPDIEKGAVDARRTRVVTSTRFAARAGADRHLYVAVQRRPADVNDNSESTNLSFRTDMIPIAGAWADRADELCLQTPEKNPMSLVLDRDKFVYGCTDGTIVMVGFEGDRYEP